MIVVITNQECNILPVIGKPLCKVQILEEGMVVSEL